MAIQSLRLKGMFVGVLDLPEVFVPLPQVKIHNSQVVRLERRYGAWCVRYCVEKIESIGFLRKRDCGNAPESYYIFVPNINDGEPADMFGIVF